MFYSLKHDPQPRNKTSLLKTKIFLSNSLAFHSQIRTKSQMAEVRHHRPIPHTLPTRRLLLPSVLSSSSTCHSLLPSVVSSSLLIRTLSMWVAVLGSKFVKLISAGYVGEQEVTSATLLPDGWMRTGDLCYEDSFLFIVDGLKDLVKYKGCQVAPAELEHLLLSHPEMVDAAVIP
ncbi:hypothetical protein CISIN_1g030653mg [Citrus sinensis]|uniref:4-coumarate--CoA ligase n=1 Tax=Citrus sinensis TaxID=2711 RepID=A0A067E254_CITSI|nr:hypothetical protein CISIN_1g030653mg [Citrus sinensis]